MLERSFEVQEKKLGFSIVEILSTCPIGWGMTATEAMAHVEKEVVQTYPLGVIVDRTARHPPRRPRQRRAERWNTGVIFAGFGGQGLLFAGHVLAEAALLEGRRSRGCPHTVLRCAAERRRAPSSFQTSQLARRSSTAPTAVVALNPPSMARFEPTVAEGGLLVVNTSLIEAEPSRRDIEILAMPARRSPARPAMCASSASWRSAE